jgi:hypothetical protein
MQAQTKASNRPAGVRISEMHSVQHALCYSSQQLQSLPAVGPPKTRAGYLVFSYKKKGKVVPVLN